jgi:hypothetical protein
MFTAPSDVALILLVSLDPVIGAGADSSSTCSLALMEMRLILARVFWNFDLEPMPDSVDWLKKQKSYHIWEKGALNAKVHLRKT